MRAPKGFTLLEILVVLIILGLVAAFTFPNFVSSIEQAKAQVAQNNLYAILAAQQRLNEFYPGSYCINTGANPTGFTLSCGDNIADLNTNLHLGLSGPFAYSCAAVVGTIPFNCTATDGTDTLTLDPNAISPTLPVSCSGPAGKCPL